MYTYHQSGTATICPRWKDIRLITSSMIHQLNLQFHDQIYAHRNMQQPIISTSLLSNDLTDHFIWFQGFDENFPIFIGL